jgi:hypothetical protein
MQSDDIPAAPSVYRPDHIILYGVKLNRSSANALLPFDKKTLSFTVTDADGTIMPPNRIAIIVAYGYSFEGQCYRFDRPKMFVFDRFEEIKEASGCGFGSDYSMWTISSQQILLELTTSADLAETLILEANLPGNQPPNTYGNKMQLAHRGGRVTRHGGP